MEPEITFEDAIDILVSKGFTISISKHIPKKEDPPKNKNLEPGKRYAHGLKGIQELFNVSHATAQKYKDGIIKDAVFQSGRKIVVDVDKALELFNSRDKMQKK